MRMSQWSAALESFKVGAGAEGLEASVEFAGGVRKQVNAAALLPQMVAIPSGNSHWLEIPRVGTGFWSSRKAVVAIVTTSDDEEDGRRLRYDIDVACHTLHPPTPRVCSSHRRRALNPSELQ